MKLSVLSVLALLFIILSGCFGPTAQTYVGPDGSTVTTTQGPGGQITTVTTPSGETMTTSEGPGGTIKTTVETESGETVTATSTQGIDFWCDEGTSVNLVSTGGMAESYDVLGLVEYKEEELCHAKVEKLVEGQAVTIDHYYNEDRTIWWVVETPESGEPTEFDATGQQLAEDYEQMLEEAMQQAQQEE